MAFADWTIKQFGLVRKVGGALVGPFGESIEAGGPLGTFASVAALESAYPAASNNGKSALVGTVLYECSGGTWVQGTASPAAVAAGIAAMDSTQLATVQSLVSGGSAFLGFAAMLSMGNDSTGVYVTGDSTTTPDTAWFRLFANYIAGKYPAYTTRYWKWNDSTQKYDRPIVISSAGALRAMKMATGGTRVGRTVSGPHISGTIEVIVRIKSPQYVGSQVIVSKYQTGPVFQVNLGGDGNIYFAYSTDGSTLVSVSSTTGHGLVNGTEYFLKWQFVPNDGGGNRTTKFFKSTDGVEYTQIGATVTSVGVVTLFTNSDAYSVGARGLSSLPCVADTEIYEVWINDGIDGAPIVPPLVHNWPVGIGTGVNSTVGAPEINFVMGAHPGAGIGYERNTTGYLNDQNRLKKIAVDFGQQIAMFNSSHNEYEFKGPDWASTYFAWVESTQARMPAVQRIAFTQNPRTVSAGSATIETSRLGHRTRRALLMSSARAKNVEVIDSYAKFLRDGRAMNLLVGDSLHPTEEGYSLWYSAVRDEFDSSARRVS